MADYQTVKNQAQQGCKYPNRCSNIHQMKLPGNTSSTSSICIEGKYKQLIVWI